MMAEHTSFFCENPGVDITIKHKSLTLTLYCLIIGFIVTFDNFFSYIVTSRCKLSVLLSEIEFSWRRVADPGKYIFVTVKRTMYVGNISNTIQ